LDDKLIVALAMGPSRQVRTWKRYSINGYKFRVFNEAVDIPKSTVSNGVCMNSIDGSSYYGVLEEIIELTYTSVDDIYRTVLFKCDWIDNSNKGLKIHDTYKLVEVNRNEAYPHYDPFVLSYQVEQVCYAPYPTTKKENQWSAVFKIKARSDIDAPVDEGVFQEDVSVVGQQITPTVGDEDDEEIEVNDDPIEDEEEDASEEVAHAETEDESEEEVDAENEDDSSDDEDDVLFIDDDDDDL
jgi:Domain of unknown function (DUF4216)